MRDLPYQYNLPESVVPFSTIKGGVALIQANISAQACPRTKIDSVGQINWVLKNRQTDKIFLARQSHNRIDGDIIPALQSEIPLTAGNNYETLKVTSPAPQAGNLRRPDQAGVIAKPSVGLAKGTHIMTEHGEIAIENLRPGIRLITRDHGMQRLRWVGQTRAKQPLSAVRFHAGAINNCRDMIVCANQLIVLKGAEAIMRFGKREVFASACSFVDDVAITTTTQDQPCFYQLLLDSHQVIYAEAAACESFLPTTANLTVLPLSARLDIHLMLPNIQSDPASFGPLARSVVSAQF